MKGLNMYKSYMTESEKFADNYGKLGEDILNVVYEHFGIWIRSQKDLCIDFEILLQAASEETRKEIDEKRKNRGNQG